LRDPRLPCLAALSTLNSRLSTSFGCRAPWFRVFKDLFEPLGSACCWVTPLQLSGLPLVECVRSAARVVGVQGLPDGGCHDPVQSPKGTAAKSSPLATFTSGCVIVPGWQLLVVIAGDVSNAPLPAVGSGKKAQSEPHCCATGNRGSLPAACCRMRTASRTVTRPSPSTSAATCCPADNSRRPTTASSTHIASLALPLSPGTPRLPGVSVQFPDGIPVTPYSPVESVCADV